MKNSKKGILIAIIAVVIVGVIIAGIFVIKGLSHTSASWGNNVLCDIVPETDLNKCDVIKNEADCLNFTIKDCTDEDYEAYADAWEECGFNDYESRNDEAFFGINSENYRVMVYNHSDEGELNVYVWAPHQAEPLGDISNELAQLLPELSEYKGEIEEDEDEHFCVKVYLENDEEYDILVNQCIDAGFQSEREEVHPFYGQDADGNKIQLSFNGLDSRSVTITIFAADFS